MPTSATLIFKGYVVLQTSLIDIDSGWSSPIPAFWRMEDEPNL